MANLTSHTWGRDRYIQRVPGTERFIEGQAYTDIADTIASLVANLTSHTWGRDRYSQRLLNDI